MPWRSRTSPASRRRWVLLPDALRYRERAEEIHRRQGNAYTLAFDLTNRAELLIRLGHGEKAEALLREVDAGIDKGIDAYVGRTRRVKVLRTLRATVDGRWADTVTAGLSVGPGPAKRPMGRRSWRRRSSIMRAHVCAAAASRVQPHPPASLPLPTSREIRYWRVGDPPGFRRKRDRVGWRVGTARRALPRAVARARVASGRNGRSRGPAAARPRGFRARPRRPRPAGLAAPRDHLGERISLDLHGASRYSRAAPVGRTREPYATERSTVVQTTLVLIAIAAGVALYFWKFKKRLGGNEIAPRSSERKAEDTERGRGNRGKNWKRLTDSEWKQDHPDGNRSASTKSPSRTPWKLLVSAEC